MEFGRTDFAEQTADALPGGEAAAAEDKLLWNAAEEVGKATERG